MVAAVVDLHFEVDDFVPRKEAVLGCLLDALVDRGDVLLGNGAAQFLDILGNGLCRTLADFPVSKLTLCLESQAALY